MVKQVCLSYMLKWPHEGKNMFMNKITLDKENRRSKPAAPWQPLPPTSQGKGYSFLI